MCLNSKTVLCRRSWSSWSYTTIRDLQREHRCRPATAAVESSRTTTRRWCTLCCSSGHLRPFSTHGRLLQSMLPVWSWRCCCLNQPAPELPPLNRTRRACNSCWKSCCSSKCRFLDSMCLNNKTVPWRSWSSCSYTTIRDFQREHWCRPARAAVESNFHTTTRRCCTLCCSSGHYRPSSTDGRRLKPMLPAWTSRCCCLNHSAPKVTIAR